MGGRGGGGEDRGRGGPVIAKYLLDRVFAPWPISSSAAQSRFIVARALFAAALNARMHARTHARTYAHGRADAADLDCSLPARRQSAAFAPVEVTPKIMTVMKSESRARIAAQTRRAKLRPLFKFGSPPNLRAEEKKAE